MNVSQMTGATKWGKKGRYTSKRLMASAHDEAIDMWEFSASRNQIHPLSATKNTIAEHALNSTVKVRDSIPSRTFKNQHFPRTLAVENFNEVAEADSQPLNVTVSPLEYAAMMNVQHRIPKRVMKNLKPRTNEEGRSSVMIRKGKWRITNARKNTKKPKFNRGSRTGTDLEFAQVARSNASGARNILATGAADSFLTDQFFAPKRPGEHAIMNPRMLAAAINVVAKWMSGQYQNLPADLLKDPDVSTILEGGVNWTDPTIIATFAEQLSKKVGKTISPQLIATALRAIMGIISKAQDSQKKREKPV